MTPKMQTRRVNLRTCGKRLSCREIILKRHNAGMIRSLLSIMESATDETNSIPVEAEKPPKNANKVSHS